MTTPTTNAYDQLRELFLEGIKASQDRERAEWNCRIDFKHEGHYPYQCPDFKAADEAVNTICQEFGAALGMVKGRETQLFGCLCPPDAINDEIVHRFDCVEKPTGCERCGFLDCDCQCLWHDGEGYEHEDSCARWQSIPRTYEEAS